MNEYEFDEMIEYSHINRLHDFINYSNNQISIFTFKGDMGTVAILRAQVLEAQRALELAQTKELLGI